MKGLFLLQRRFAYVGHELAKQLKEKGIVDDFCGYVQVREGFNFLKLQNEIRYSGLILDEDIFKKYKDEALDMKYLAELELQYGSLWKYINIDRIFRYGLLLREYPHDTSPYTYEELLRILQVYAKNINAFLDEQKPDFVYGSVFGSLGTLLLYDMAKKRGIPVLTTIVPSTRDLVTLTESCDRLTGVEELFKSHFKKSPEHIPHYKEARLFIEEFRRKPFAYSNVVMTREKRGKWEQFAFLRPRNIFWTLYFNTIRIFMDWMSDSERRADFTTVNPFLHLYDRTRRKVRNFIGMEYLYDEFNTAKRYAFYPLQYEPESTILSYAGDQMGVIKLVARSLPVGMYLYVKEHPQMAPMRPRRFYREIKKIPNVRLMRPTMSSFELIRNSDLVTVINSTPGWEAILLGKPVITFGEIFYNALSFIGHSTVPGELPMLITKQLNSKVDDEELVRFLAAMFEDSAMLDLLYLWEIEADPDKRHRGLKTFVDLLVRKLKYLK